jgi:hypothetical protein
MRNTLAQSFASGKKDLIGDDRRRLTSRARVAMLGAATHVAPMSVAKHRRQKDTDAACQSPQLGSHHLQ